jgi:nucleotide-binding universal stress UspA family protein
MMMFKRLLVPLDGSHLAESALPAAVYLAVKMTAPVILIHVIEKNAPEKVHGERHLTTPEHAIAYLAEIAGRFFPSEVKVESHVHTSEVSNVSQSIVQHIDEFSPDLIVMCTHGESGLKNILYGSIAQQVIGIGKTPVLLIQPTEGESWPPFAIHKIDIPVDGQPEHEQGIPIAADLAKFLNASLHLILVVPTLGTLKAERAATGRFLPASMRIMLDLAEENAETYLASQAEKLTPLVKSVTTEVSRGDPALAIAQTSETTGADLIVLTTHGKSGQDAFWASSVAPKVSELTHIPLLLVPVYT